MNPRTRETSIAVYDTIVEDCETTAEAVREYYQRRGEQASVRTFTESQCFLTDFRRRRYDMAFLAVNNPLDLAVAHSAGGMDSGCPLIFVSGTGDYAIEAFRLPVTDYILKPVTWERVDESAGRRGCFE
ncbi:MAG: response regulator [Defluviitaleaceae bacterium]|nr:response regulator [Defluviitaleaceae bacterium]